MREVWNTRGWNLPPAGESRTIDDETIRIGIGVDADGPLSSVTCFAD